MNTITQNAFEPLDTWDPLESHGADPGIVFAAQRREIRNILKSYTGYYDLFSELLQNSLDAVERRTKENPESGYRPKIWVKIDMKSSSISVTDNGCGMDLTQFKQFLRPNFSFKEDRTSRGCKGVGATYLGYGFNHLEVATRFEGRTFSGILRRGREWVEDKTNTIPRPKVENSASYHEAFAVIDRGTSMTVKLTGGDIRPKNLSWVGATSAETWLAVLRAMTPLGGSIYAKKEVPRSRLSLKLSIPPLERRQRRFLMAHGIYSHTKSSIDPQIYATFSKTRRVDSIAAST